LAIHADADPPVAGVPPAIRDLLLGNLMRTPDAK
jgi:hypothetical protein